MDNNQSSRKFRRFLDILFYTSMSVFLFTLLMFISFALLDMFAFTEIPQYLKNLSLELLGEDHVSLLIGFFFVNLLIANTAGFLRENLKENFQVSNTSMNNLPPKSRYEIMLGNFSTLQTEQALGYIKTILSLAQNTTTTFSIWAVKNTISFMITFDADFLGEDTFREVTLRYYPSATVNKSPDLSLTFPIYEQLQVFQRNKIYDFFESIIGIDQIYKFDPLAQLHKVLSSINANEAVYLALTVYQPNHYTQESIDYLMTQTRAEAGIRTPNYDGKSAFINAYRDNVDRVNKYTASDERRYRAKLSQPIHETIIAIQIFSPDERRLSSFAPAITSIIDFSDVQHPIIERGHSSTHEREDTIEINSARNVVTKGLREQRESLDKNSYWNTHVFYLTTSEISALWHLPHEGFEIERTGNRQVKASEKILKIENGVRLGVNQYAGETYPIYIGNNDRTTHMAIIGRTRTGKSTLLHQKIHQDITQGRGVCVIDPEGELVSSILQNSIPKSRENDVVILDISTLVDNVFYPPPFNILLNLQSKNKQASLRKLNDIFETLFTSFQLKKMADTLDRALQTLQGEPHPTLLDLRRQFIDLEYRNHITKNIKDFVLKQEIEQFNKLSEKQQQADAYPLYWRLRSFYGNPYLRAMTCHPERLDLHDLVSKNKIILVSLGDEDEMYSEEDRFVLGTSIIHQIELVARSGAITQEPFMLYIDEAQEFIKTRLPNMLSRMGKRGLGVVLANQYFGQLFSDTQDAIEGNVGTFISFEIGQKDARTFVPYFDGFTTDDLTKLGKYSTVVSMRVGEDRPPAFSMDTLPPPKNEQATSERELYLRRLSIENMNLKTYGEVNEWLARRYEGVDFTKDTDPPEGFQDDFIEPDEDIDNDDEEEQ